MRNLLFFILFAATIGNTFAKKNAINNSPVLGTWKFTKKSAINEFQQVQLMNKNETVKEEFFVVSAKNKFQHQFVNDKGIVVKTLTGTWKADKSKIKIEYHELDYKLNVDYFFIGTDLVLGQNFSHVIFTKDNLNDQNITMK
ncbi:MAG TPA: hypothetical protein PK431_04675 [Chitinophagales bacterium]|nr:hypothetical protein [Chitinophagales bacterium]